MAEQTFRSPGFFEQEIKDGKSEQWIGSDLSWKIN